MKNYKKSLLIFGSLVSAFFFSCSKSETNDLHDAQLCLNSATPGSAMNCVSKIAGDTSPLAYSLRCSAIFITQGFGDASAFVDALSNINGGSNGCGGGCSSTVATLQALKFDAAGIANVTDWDANNAAAAEAFAQCSKADAKIYTQIASLFQLGTLTSMMAYSMGVSGTLTETDLKNAIVSGTIDATVVGGIVTVTYENTCTGDLSKASDTTKSYCDQLTAAENAGATPQQIGACLLKKLSDPNATCP
ncbi:MAG: hypothetical protein ACXVAX_05980 [Pseudobdellovibrio sp.]